MIDVPTVDVTQPIAPAEPERDPFGLDQLIPPAMSKRKRAVVAGGLISMAVALTMLVTGGYLIPRPIGLTSTGQFGQVSYIADAEAGLIGVIVEIDNYSRRTVRAVDVDFVAPGVEVDRVEVLAEGDGGWILNPAVGLPTKPLPHRIEPQPENEWERVDHRFLVWLKPTSCQDEPGSRAIVNATFDFGEGAFPPFSRTEQVIFIEWDANATAFIEGGVAVKGSGPLAVACEVLS